MSPATSITVTTKLPLVTFNQYKLTREYWLYGQARESKAMYEVEGPIETGSGEYSEAAGNGQTESYGIAVGAGDVNFHRHTEERPVHEIAGLLERSCDCGETINLKSIYCKKKHKRAIPK
ncbi:hypothetical protein PR048_013525 [Dryococelus australis]|uniref:Uncharacterized protein n=1 Tax=Dryococelus australis TaxID=614101 RepID=A0ABQ9HSF4_9NEOP|nr:hypothetical protein PR048_013525 [Dryococelus australis]